MPHICSLLQVSPETYNLLRQIRMASSANSESNQAPETLANLNSYRIAGCVSRKIYFCIICWNFHHEIYLFYFPLTKTKLWYETSRNIISGEEILLDGRCRTPVDLLQNYEDTISSGKLFAKPGQIFLENRSTINNEDLHRECENGKNIPIVNLITSISFH